MKNEILVDTNIAIYSFQGKKSVNKLIAGETITISFITEIELLSWPRLAPEEFIYVDLFIKQCRLIEYSPRLKEGVIDIRRRYNLSVSDSFVAATAWMLEIPLLSADRVYHKVKEIDFFHVKP